MAHEKREKAMAAIWQGFHHAWEYNHRLNRFGSYVDVDPADGRPEVIVGHTAASGTGGDTAHFTEFVTPVTAAEVGFQTGEGETEVECMRGVTTTFRIKVVDLALDPALVGKETYAVVLNGFDLIAEHHSDKLISFDLEITDPVVYADGTKVRFEILGTLRFDCRTAECQLWPFGLEMEDVGREKDTSEPKAPPTVDDATPPLKRGIKRSAPLEKMVNWLKRQIATFTDLENVKRSILENEENRQRRRLFRLLGTQFYLRLLKWRIATPYTLRVRYLILGGDDDALRVTESDYHKNAYGWDAETEIHRESLGVLPVTVRSAPPLAWACNTFGFKRLSLTTEMDQEFSSENPIQWGQGIHLLEWSVAVREIRAEGDRMTAELDLFYKAWSEAMNEVITLTTWGALRSAGRATVGARLALLQFKDAEPTTQRALSGHVHWPGGGLNAKEHPRARAERALIPSDRSDGHA